MPRARVSNPLADPVRLATLRGTGLLGTPHEDAFDRLAGLARKVLRTPVGMVSLLDDRHLHVKSCVGLPDLAKAGKVPATESFCQHVVITEQALLVEDAREHELTGELAIVKSGMALAYPGVPLVLSRGSVVGALSVADSEPRAWRPEDVEILQDLAASVLTEIEMRADIEARKRAESDLQRSTDRLRALMDNSPTIIFAKDLEGRYLFLNHAGEQLLGLPESQAIGRTDADLHPAEVAAGLRESDEAVIAGGEPVKIEDTIDIDGRTIVYRSVKFPLTDEAGEPYGVCGISTDITERKQTERALREAQQRFVSAFEHAPTGMAMVGTDGRFRQVIQALCDLTGRTEDDLLRMTLVDATALTDAEGRPTEFLVQFQDITEEEPATDLDLGVLRRLTGETGGAQNAELIRDLAGLFREDSRRGLKQVADALRQKDAQGVARAAHALKGSSGQLGAARTEMISAELQAVAESGELGDAKALLRRLETAVDAAQSALSSALPETPVR